MSHSHSHSHSHGDDHSHSHSHSHGNDDVTANESQTLLEHNRKHFDSKARTYINEASTFMAKHCKEAIVAAATGDLSEKSALDFACGPGTVTLQVAPLLKEVVGADISTGMVEEYGNQAKLAGMENKMRAVQLQDGTDLSALKGQKFDLIFCCHSYHHFHDLDKVTKMLSEALNPQGQLIVLDFLASESLGENGAFISDEAAASKGVHHKHGFSPEDMQRLFGKYFKTVDAKPAMSIHKSQFETMQGGDMLKPLLNRTRGDYLQYIIAAGTL